MFPRSPAVCWKVTDPSGDTVIFYWGSMMGRVKGLGFFDFFRGSFNSKKNTLIVLQLPKQERKPFRIVLKKTIIPFFFWGAKKALFSALWHISESFGVHFRVISECLSGWLVDDVPFVDSPQIMRWSFRSWDRKELLPCQNSQKLQTSQFWLISCYTMIISKFTYENKTQGKHI